MITTDDSELAARLRRLRHQGMSISDLERHRAAGFLVEEYPEVGFNFRLSDLQAALGLVQLEKLPLFLEKRRAAAARYRAALVDFAELELPFVPDHDEPNYQSYIVRLRGVDGRQRDAVLDAMLRRGIGVRRGLMASHREACHESTRRAGDLRQTERAADQTLVLPMYSELDPTDQDRVVDELREALRVTLSESGGPIAREVQR